jgi:hypothetical protein
VFRDLAKDRVALAAAFNDMKATFAPRARR